MKNLKENIEIIESITSKGVTIDILEYKELKGALSSKNALNLFLLKEANMNLRQIRITLNNEKIITEAGALYYYKGNIECHNDLGGVGGLFSKVIKGSLNKEAMFKPIYQGTGEVYLEPRFGHFLIVPLENDTIIVDKGMFYCCTEGLKVDVITQANLAGMFGGEGFFQTKISGTGVCVLESPVPEDEIEQIPLYGEKLKVDGNFAILRTGGVNFSIEKSAKTVMGTITSGEGLLQTFSGTGQVWLAPTMPVYRVLESSDIKSLASTSNISNLT